MRVRFQYPPTLMRTLGLSRVKQGAQEPGFNPVSSWLPSDLCFSLLFNQGLKVNQVVELGGSHSNRA